jgi:hypothetical protein
MNRHILSCIISCIIFTGSLTQSMAKTMFRANNFENIVGRNDSFVDLNGIHSLIDSNNTATLEDVSPTANIGSSAYIIPLKEKSNQIKVSPSIGSCQGGCNKNEYYIQISGAAFGNGWDINSVTICGIEVCRIMMQSSNMVVVYPDSGTPGTGDIVITSESKGKTTIKAGFTYQVPVSNEQAKETPSSLNRQNYQQLGN